MNPINFSRLAITQIIVCGAVLCSSTALLYHVRWFIPYLSQHVSYVVPNGEEPMIWFSIQIISNLIFIWVGSLLLALFRKYQKTGFFDTTCLATLDRIQISFLLLAVLGIIKLGFSTSNDMQMSELNFVSFLPMSARFILHIVAFKEPCTIYILAAITIWAVKQLLVRSLLLKVENEAFI